MQASKNDPLALRSTFIRPFDRSKNSSRHRTSLTAALAVRYQRHGSLSVPIFASMPPPRRPSPHPRSPCILDPLPSPLLPFSPSFTSFWSSSLPPIRLLRFSAGLAEERSSDRAMKFQLVSAIVAVLCTLSAAAPRADPKECEGALWGGAERRVRVRVWVDTRYSCIRTLIRQLLYSSCTQSRTTILSTPARHVGTR